MEQELRNECCDACNVNFIDEEEEEHPAHPAYYCDGGCGKKVGNGRDHDCKRICDDCEEDDEE